VLFTVFVGVLPVTIRAEINSIINNSSLDINKIVVQGDLFLISIAIEAEAFGENIGVGRDFVFFKLFAGGAACAVLIAACTFYGAMGVLQHQLSGVDMIISFSWHLFVSSIVVGALCIIASGTEGFQGQQQKV
jgi:hypothetical protein